MEKFFHKIIIFILLITMMLLIIFESPVLAAMFPASIKMSNTVLTLFEGESFKLSAKLSPSNVTNAKVTWTSSNKQIATVSSVGLVTAKKTGRATITAITANGKKATCSITVKQKYPTSIKLSNSSLTLGEGAAFKLSVTLNPKDVKSPNVTWKSSNTQIVAVSSNGVVTAKKAGTATITATTANGKKDYCYLTVKKQYPNTIKMSDSTLTLGEGQTSKLSVTLSPSDVINPEVTWRSSNTQIVVVSSTGVVTTKKAGAAIITATTANGKKATCNIIVKQKYPSSIKMSKDTLTIGEKQTSKLNITLSPIDVMNSDITWTSSDTKIATVSSVGIVTAKKAGTVTIKAISADRKAEASCNITVKKVNPDNIKLYYSNITLNKGGDFKLNAILSPSDVINTKVTWKTSDDNIATVSQDGNITLNENGKVKITAAIANGKTATCEITILDKGTQILNEANSHYQRNGEDMVTNVLGADYFDDNNERPNWCAYFVSYCYKMAGAELPAYELDPINDLVDSASDIVDWAKGTGKWCDDRENYTPQPGDIIVFGQGGYKHVGLVEKVKEGNVYTIEGNTGNSDAGLSVVGKKEYDLKKDTYIQGFVKLY